MKTLDSQIDWFCKQAASLEELLDIGLNPKDKVIRPEPYPQMYTKEDVLNLVRNGKLQKDTVKQLIHSLKHYKRTPGYLSPSESYHATNIILKLEDLLDSV
jgi:hypothetical protein